MLSLLHIENIAVIESADIEFEAGFNVLTGETGAGKSIVIDAIGAVLGERTSKDLVRTGSKAAHVSAVFTAMENALWLNEFGAGIEPGEELLIQRDISAEGKNTCRVNGRPVTTAVLRQIGDRLITIHGQHDSRQLFDESTHLACLDGFADHAPLIEAYQQQYHELLQLEKRIRELSIDEGEKLRRMEALKFQIADIEQAGLTDGEEEELLERRKFLHNTERITQSVQGAYYAVCGDDESEGAAGLITDAQRSLEYGAALSKDVEQANTLITDLKYQAEDVAETLRDLMSSLNYSDDELDRVEERLDQIGRLEKKYGRTIGNVLNYLDEIAKELQEIGLSDETLLRLKNELPALEKNAAEKADSLSDARKKTAKQLEKRLHDELSQLDMFNVRFSVDFKDTPLSESGRDEVRFLMSANAGEALRPMSRIASGGELARIMLAMKNVLAEKDSVPTLIFDEVDTGVSGRAAQKVADKLASVAKNRQVLCVTHLPQIAARAGYHFSIEKSEKNGRTFTEVTPLDFEGRKQELARIIGGDQITETTLKSAAEMLARDCT